MLCCMSAVRTQIYLTAAQREQLDRRRRAEGKSLAQLIRAAVDAYLDRPVVDRQHALDATFGSMPGLSVPSRDEWDRA